MRSSPDKARAIDILREIVAIESVSTDPKKQPDIRRAVDYLKRNLTPLGFSVNVVGSKLPLVFAKLDRNSTETLAFYSHYDVQPPDPLQEWHSSPFKLTEKDGRLYGRGVADDKGHIAQVIAALEEAVREKAIGKNVVLLYEGEEEVGSLEFENFIGRLAPELGKVDAFYILDSSVRDKNTPMLLYGLRGLLYYELTVKGPVHDLHSGLYGNLSPNPANIISAYLASLKDKNQKVTLPDFYQDVVKPDAKEKILLKRASGNSAEVLRGMGVKEFLLPQNMPYEFAAKTYPSFDVHGIRSGFTDEGVKTVIPSQASAKFSFRLVPNQQPAAIDRELKAYTKKFFAKYPVSYELTTQSSSFPYVTGLDNEYIQKTESVFKKHFPKPIVFNRSGGSIPAAEVLSRLFQKPVIITGFVGTGSRIHSPNENTDKELFLKGVKVIKDLLK